jgi:hypothetical protein
VHKDHCLESCTEDGEIVTFSGYKPGEHDWASVDQNGNSHCGLCYDMECKGVNLTNVESTPDK